MTSHRILVIHIGGGDLYHVVPAVAQPVADLPILFPADAFAEAGGQQQVTQLGLRVVDRHGVLTRRFGRLRRRYVVADRELVPPLVQTVASRRTVDA